MNLPIDDHRVHDRSRVVAGDVTQNEDRAGLDVDLDDRDVGAERERGSCRLEVDLGPQGGAACDGVSGQFGPASGDCRCAGDRELSGVDIEDDIGRIRLEQFGRQVLGLDDDLLGRLPDGRSPELHSL